MHQSWKRASHGLVFELTGERETANSLIRVIHPSQESKGDGSGLVVNATMRKGGRATGGYMERKADELTVIVKKGWVRKTIRKERVELTIEDTPPPFTILILSSQQM